ncbi:TIGR04141 family sporadically distributed protein [Photobacterium sp. CCB-ST2H9]|uniref:TIGR04141 family sporadically distributed protein n=1 Tax=Photobacterium sp. CCB-ST2H9 TaxID=2912855 RepID=UPI002003DAB7|nr:TIGR04141 family sporadically distributed protein [Photobacterium sp. CCB-ST2H9]UTM56706.1 TIGR04141 family sporadically distributed protein [Photobacterium sp. CCB-ST2H9]
MPTTPLSIYLLKKGINADTSVLKLNNANSHKVELEGTTSVMHVQTPTSNPPAFAKLFTESNQLTDVDFGTNQSTGAVLELQHAGQTFFVAFGKGHTMLEKDYMVHDFGLRTALNLVDTKDIRGVDTASNKTKPLNARVQSGLSAEVSDFPIDIDEDLLSAIEGLSNDAGFGSRVSGRRRALKVNFKGKLVELPKLLNKAYKKYTTALPNEFKWVENIREVTDSTIISSLNCELVTLLQNYKMNGPSQNDNVYMIAPDVYDSDTVVGFSYGANSKQRSDILSLQRYLDKVVGEKGTLELDHLVTGYKVFAKDEDHITRHTWTGYECLYCELEKDGKHYELRAGFWYEINVDFVKEINAVMENIATYDVPLPDYDHDSEGAYNKYVAANDANIECLDTKNIYLGGGQSRFEFCDLVNKNNGFDNKTDLIHVKHYTSSATLSHLFSQGVVSAEIFRRSEEARQKLYSDHPGVMPLTDPAVAPNAGDYRIVYAIYDIDALPTKLPFFSKVNLKNAYYRLDLLGYKVALAHIDVHPNKRAQTKAKQAKNAKLPTAA